MTRDETPEHSGGIPEAGFCCYQAGVDLLREVQAEDAVPVFAIPRHEHGKDVRWP
jgi:hypothetical protein